MPTPSASHIYLSPHLDDAVLSCGGRIAQQVAAGAAPRVLNIMAGDPPTGNLSPFASRTHRDWGDVSDMVATRRAEDRAALALLGASFTDMDWPDAIYRRLPDGGWPYTSNDTLFGPLHPAEERLIGQLAAEVAAHAGPAADAVLYAPLAAGQHVDHLLARAAALRLWHDGYAVLFYEDIPYAMWPGQIAMALTGLPAHVMAESHLLSQDNLNRKLWAVQKYRTQLAGLFGTAEAAGPMLFGFAERTGAGAGLAERYWRLTG